MLEDGSLLRGARVGRRLAVETATGMKSGSEAGDLPRARRAHEREAVSPGGRTAPFALPGWTGGARVHRRVVRTPGSWEREDPSQVRLGGLTMAAVRLKPGGAEPERTGPSRRDGSPSGGSEQPATACRHG